VSSEREPLRLQDVIVNIDRIESYLTGYDRARFVSDGKTVDAVERCLQRITEAVIKIGPERMADIAPDIPVEAIRGLGNVLRHDYDRIDTGLIWTTVVDRLPELRAAVVTALDKGGMI
jgi:uncharacterized protein with HEPN domain